jgi:lipopolysaccharide transport system permease protein
MTVVSAPERVQALLGCPHCAQGLVVLDHVVRCEGCGYRRAQPDRTYLDLRPLRADDPEWHRRQRAMEAWYRNLARDPAAAVDSFEHDYSGLIPVLEEVTGRVVDVGGGLGIARQYLGPVDEYVNVDPSLFWRRMEWPTLEARYPMLGEPAPFIRGSGEHLPLRTGTFDVALALWSLNNTREPRRVLREIHRVLRPGGRLIVVLEDVSPTEEDLCRHPDLAERSAGIQLQPDHLPITEEQLLADAAGFAVIRREWIQHYLMFEFVRDDAAADVEPPGASPSTGRALLPPPPDAVTRGNARIQPPLAGRIHLPSLLWTLIRTDFKLRYHGSLGGFVWALLRPLSLFIVLQSVFSLIFKTDPQYRLNLVIGLFLWDFFVEASKSGLAALASKGHLLTKVRFPKWLLVLASTANAVITIVLFGAFLLLSLALSGRAPSLLHVALFAGYLVLFFMIVLGFSLAASVLFVRYRDLNQLWDLITQVGFFAAPIVYPLAILPERIHAYLYCWPPTPVVQFSRSVLVAGSAPTLRAHAFLVLEAVLTLAIGMIVYRRYAGRAAEYL